MLDIKNLFKLPKNNSKVKRLIPFYFLLFIVSCSPSLPPKDTLTLLLSAEPKTLDPRKASQAESMRLTGLIFQSLVKLGPRLQLQGDAAKTWRQEANNYIFYIPSFRFSNGRKVKAEDIIFSLKEFRKKSCIFYSAFKKISQVQVKKKQAGFELRIKLNKMSANFLTSELPVIKILPKKETLARGALFGKQPIGSGKYTFVSKKHQEILLKKRQASPLPYLKFFVIKDPLTRVQQMLAGKIDIAPSGIGPSQLFIFRDKKFKIFSQVSLSTSYLLLNLKNPHLKQTSFRHLLSQSLDRASIIKYKLKQQAIPAYGLLSPSHYFFNPQLKQVTFKQNISIPTSIKLTLNSSNAQDTVDKARVLVSQMNRIKNVEVSLKTHEWGTLYKDLSRGQFDLALMKWVGVTDPDIYGLAFHSSNLAPQGRNRSFYQNSKLDKLLDQGVKEVQLKKRKEIYNKVQEFVYKNMLVIPLWHPKDISVIKNSIKNYTLPLNGDFSTLHLVEKG